MVVCEFAIKVAIGDYFRFTQRKFTFANVPRIGEKIWIGESLGFKIDDVQYGFTDDETPSVRIESEERTPAWYARNEPFLIEWGFSRINSTY